MSNFLLLQKDLFSSLMDPFGFLRTLQRIWEIVGGIVQEQKDWTEVLSTSSGPSAECCSQLAKLRGIFGRLPAHFQQKGEM